MLADEQSTMMLESVRKSPLAVHFEQTLTIFEQLPSTSRTPRVLVERVVNAKPQPIPAIQGQDKLREAIKGFPTSRKLTEALAYLAQMLQLSGDGSAWMIPFGAPSDEEEAGHLSNLGHRWLMMDIIWAAEQHPVYGAAVVKWGIKSSPRELRALSLDSFREEVVRIENMVDVGSERAGPGNSRGGSKGAGSNPSSGNGGGSGGGSGGGGGSSVTITPVGPTTGAAAKGNGASGGANAKGFANPQVEVYRAAAAEGESAAAAVVEGKRKEAAERDAEAGTK
jgi:hypothetical protein